METNWYSDLSLEVAEKRLEERTDEYWNTMDLLGAIQADRAKLLNIIKQRHEERRYGA